MNLFLLIYLSVGETYAIVVAGSSSFKNYRHQADAFQMYNKLIGRGIPRSRIILFAYNDLLTNEKNPYPGKIINKPEGPNVYPGDESIDFSGPYVTAPVFYSVLYGNNESGKKFNLSENDTLLLFFNDHGAPGLLSMPRESGTKIYANELRDLFRKMKIEKKYKKIFFVIEACESGSVGEVIDVPDVLTITASNAKDPSHAAKWDDTMNAFLSNEFTSNIFKFLDSNVDSTVEEFVKFISNKTIKSSVCLFGDKSVMKNKLSDFFGLGTSTNGVADDVNNENDEDDLGILMNAHSVFPASLLMMLKKVPENDTKKRHELIDSFNHEMKRRNKISESFKKIEEAFNIKENHTEQSNKVLNWTCYKTVVEKSEKYCGKCDESSFHNLIVFARLCNHFDSSHILNKVKRICNFTHKTKNKKIRKRKRNVKHHRQHK